jgi:cytoskeletal protein CcmA (bactofilin family)
MCRFAWKLIALILLFVLLPVSSLQATMEYVPAGQVVEGPLLMSGNNIRVDGKVDGDLYATGTDVFISGEVTGDIIAAGQNISISGPVQGDLRLAAQNIRLHGVTQGSATLFCQDLDFNQQAIINKDMLLFARSARLQGDLQRNLKGSLQSLYLSGKIGQNLQLYNVEHLELDEAQIGGDLSYRSTNKAVISPGTTINGEEKWRQPSPAQPAPQNKLPSWGIWGGLLINFLGLLIVWGIIKAWRPHLWSQIAEKAGQRAAPPPGYPDTGLGTLFDRNWHSPWDYTPFDLHGSFICKHSDSSPILKPDLKRAHELQRTRHLAGSGTSSAADAGSEDSFRRLDPGTHNTLFRSGQHTQNPLGQVFDRGIMPNIRDLSPTSGGRPQVAPTGHIDVLLSIRPCNRRSPLQGILGADGAGAAVPGALVSTPGTAVIPSVPNSHKKYRGCFAHKNKARPVLPGYF